MMLDAVFHHVGREIWAFRDVQERGKRKPVLRLVFPRFFSNESCR